MKLRTLSALAAIAGMSLVLTGCDDRIDGPGYASVTIGTGINTRPHHRPYYGNGPYYGCRGYNCYPAAPYIRPVPRRYYR